MNKLYIVNDIDRPHERLIAEEREGLLYYIHPDLRDEWASQPMSMADATPLSDFGLRTESLPGYLVGILFPKRATATYPDGRLRKWQGSNIFRFKCEAAAPPAQEG